MTDHDTLELRRIVDSDPAHPAPPDVAGLRAAGAAQLRRRRWGAGAAALAVTAAVAAPTYLLVGTTSDTVTDPAGAGVPVAPSGPQAPESLECGVLSCIDREADEPETGTVVDSVEVGALPQGGQELLYLVRTRGVDLRTNEPGQVDVLKAGYRVDGKVYGTAWALQPGFDSASAPRFWANPGLVGSRDGGTANYVVLGYVDGAPDEITWSEPDGTTDEVDGILRLDGYTAFYLTRPMPDDYVPPNTVTRNEDGSITIETQDGSRTVDGTGSLSIKEMIGEHAYEGFPPDLVIHTSDGWSCSLEDCGTMG